MKNVKFNHFGLAAVALSGLLGACANDESVPLNDNQQRAMGFFATVESPKDTRVGMWQYPNEDGTFANGKFKVQWQEGEEIAITGLAGGEATSDVIASSAFKTASAGYKVELKKFFGGNMDSSAIGYYRADFPYSPYRILPDIQTSSGEGMAYYPMHAEGDKRTLEFKGDMRRVVLAAASNMERHHNVGGTDRRRKPVRRLHHGGCG